MTHNLKKLALVSGLLMSLAASAQEYPTRLVRLITGGSLGGPVDIASRAIAHRLSEIWKQPVIVENRPGASEIIATEAVAKAIPDGYTLLIAGNSFTHNPALFSKLPYDVSNFMPISQMSVSPMALVTNAKAPYNSIAALVAAAKSRPGQIPWGSAGVGTNNHLAGEQFAVLTGTKLLHVPYKGSAGAANATLSNEVQFSIVALSSVLPLAKAGTLKVLAVTTEKRTALAPDVPSLSELGVRGIDAAVRSSLYAPAGTPRSVITKVNADVNRVLQEPAMRGRLQSLGMEPVGTTPEGLEASTRRLAAESEKIVAEANIKLD